MRFVEAYALGRLLLNEDYYEIFGIIEE